MMNLLSYINTAFFILFVLGTNVHLVFVSKGTTTIELTKFLLRSFILGILTTMVPGYVFIFLSIPNYSIVLAVFLGITSIMLTLVARHQTVVSVTCLVNDDTWRQFYLFLPLLVIRLLFLNPFEVIYDNVAYVNMSLNFVENEHVLSVMFDSTYENNYLYGAPILFGIYLAPLSLSSRVEYVLSIKLFIVLAGSFAIFPVYSFTSTFLKSKNISMLTSIFILFSSWYVIWNAFVFVDVFFFIFFSASVDYVYVFFNDSRLKDSLSFGMLAASANFCIKHNGLIQVAVLFLLLVSVLITKSVRTAFFRNMLLHDAFIPDTKELRLHVMKILVFNLTLIILGPCTFFLQYSLRNGFDPLTALFLHPQGFIGGVSSGQPEGVTLQFILERIWVSTVSMVLNFFTFFVFEEIPLLGPVLSFWFFRVLSCYLFFLFSWSQLYCWSELRNARKQEGNGNFAFLFITFWMNFSWVLLFPYPGFNVFRYIFLISIIIIPFTMRFITHFSASLKSNSLEQTLLASYIIAYALGIVGLVVVIINAAQGIFPTGGG